MITIKSFEVNYFSENTYLLYDDTKEAVLIDCGCLRKEEQKEVSDFIAQNGLTLKRYLCTHLHLDHIFGNEFVHNTYGLSPEAHKADVEGLPSPEEQAKAFGLSMKAKSVPVGKYLVNGEIIKFGKSELAVLSVPGHSPGGVAFYNKKNGFVIVGGFLVRRKHRPYRFMGRQPRYTACRYQGQITVVAGRDRGIPRPWPRDTNH